MAETTATSTSSGLPKDILIDKIKGIAIGNALGDTIGLYTEFMHHEEAEKVYAKTNFRLTEPTTPLHIDSHRARFEERAWTDDTDQMLLILLSYLHNNGTLDSRDFASRLRTWIEMGLICLDRLPLGIGQTVGGVVTHKEFLENPAAVSKKKWIQTKCFNAANGAVMRTSIIAPMFVNKSLEETYQAAIDIAAVTHADPRCLVSCVATVGILRALIKGELTEESQINGYLQHAWDHVGKDKITTDDGEEIDYTYDSKDFWAYCGVPPEKSYGEAMTIDDRRMGYTYIALGTAVWCLRRVMLGMDDFKSVITKLTMMGGDADTNGAVAGALVGAYTGFNAIAPEWRNGLKYNDWLLQKVEGMCILAGVINDKTYDGKMDKDTQLDGGRGFYTEEQMRKREEGLFKAMMERIEAAQKARNTKTPKNLWGLLG